MTAKFITFEGGEGSGKSTQAKLLFQALKQANIDSIHTREPGGTESAEAIRNMLLHQKVNFHPMTELLLHNACRYEHVKDVITPALRNNKIVICDRFVDSTMAYQGYGHKLGKKYPATLHNLLMEGVAPDLTFIFDIDPEKGLSRAKAHGEFDNYENLDIDFHRRVRQGFLEIAAMAKNRCIIINSDQPIEIIHKQVIEIVNEVAAIKLNQVSIA
jgi:dTMP kinase